MNTSNFFPGIFGRGGRNQDLLVLFGLTLLAVITRVYGIWEWSLVGDEYYTVTYAAERAKSFMNPAYYVLVLGSIDLFGLSEWSARLPAVLLGILSVPVFYVACRSMMGRKTAFIGSLLILVSSWHLYHSQSSRFYSGVFLLGILSYALYYEALRRDNYWLLGGAFVSNVLGILFHATSVMVPAACAMYSAFILLWKRSDASDYSKRIAAAHLVVSGAVGLLLLPFFFRIISVWDSPGGSWVAGPLSMFVQLTKDLEITLAASSLFGLLLLLQKNLEKGVFFALGIGVPLLALLFGSALVPPVRAKYIIYTLPLFVALSAFLCSEISRALSRYAFAKYAVPFLIIAGMMPSFVSYYTGKSSLDVREAIEVIEAGYEPGDKIISFSHSSEYFLGGYPDESLQILGGKAIWRQALKPLEDGDQRAWILVDTYRNTPLDRGLESWLTSHASLVWRKYEKRYDYPMMGYEIYVANGP